MAQNSGCLKHWRGVLGVFLLMNVATWAQASPICQYDEHNRRTDRIPENERWQDGVATATSFPIQLKNAKTGTIILPLSAGYAEAPLYLRDPEHTSCFTHRTWLQNQQGKVVAMDAQGNYLGYEPIVTSDLYLIDTGKEGLLRVKKDGKFGFADEKTGQLRIHPRYFAATNFENGRAKVAHSGVVKSLSDTDFIPIYLSDQWFYIDRDGNKLPETPTQDDLNDTRYYDWDKPRSRADYWLHQFGETSRLDWRRWLYAA